MRRPEQQLQRAIVDALRLGLPPEASIEHFWSRVDRSGGPEACWPYTGCKKPNGYGNHYVLGRGRKGGETNAHRLAFWFSRGRHPGRACVCHSCDNPSCCNPDHLWLGSHKENTADAKSKGRLAPPPRHNWPDYLDRGAHNWQKLRRADVLQIKARLATGELQRTIAADFGVNTDTVGKIKRGERWGHV